MRTDGLNPKDRIIVPLDLSDAELAAQAVEELANEVGGFKVGYELGYSIGWKEAAELVTRRGGRLFLDPKLNDIPNTVGQGARALSRFNPWILNVHASSGIDAMRAAVDNKGSALMMAVTVLTSLPGEVCEEVFGNKPDAKVLAFANDALTAGIDGLICSPRELEILASDTNLDRLLRVTPGVRPAWASTDDQKRVMTPADAVVAGADYLVIGRPITRPPVEIGSSVEAARRIAEEIRTATQAAAAR